MSRHRHRISRLLPWIGWLAVALCGHPGVAAAAEFATGLSPCKNTFPAPGAETPSQIDALDLLGSVTQLGAPRGRGVLASNLAMAIAINNRAAPAVRAQALADAQITDSNAYTLADGLGATMGDIYRGKARYESDDDGRTKRCGEIGPAVSAVIARANAQSGGDSNAAKLGFGVGLHGAYALPPGGTTDVLGKAYGRPAGTKGADRYGNSRPFLTAPFDARGPHIEVFDAVDFFGRRMSSRVVLTGTTAAETAAGLNGSDITNSPSFPSGHTTFGYTEALTLAMMVPERLQALAYRGSEYGNSRIVLGAHYPIDVIAGRTLATYDLAQDLAGRPHYTDNGKASFQATLAAATTELRDTLRQGGCPSIALCAREPIVRAANATIWANGQPHPADPRAAYAFRLDYGLAPIGATDRPPEPVPEEAGFLLQSRFPYLTQAQRREVLRTTEGPSGYFLDASPLDGAPLATAATGPAAQAGVYSRLDLFAAAGGYGSFDHDVTVDQDPAAITDPGLKPFDELTKFDTWSNDIGGAGGLTKRGSGTLRLSGHDTFAGPAIVEKGTLEITGALATTTRVEAGGTLAGTGAVRDVTVAAGGSLAPGSGDGGGALAVDGTLTLAKGSALSVHPGTHDPALMRIAGRASLEGAKLTVSPREAIPPGTRLTVIEAKGGVGGRFADVVLDSGALQPKVTYAADAVYLTLEAKADARNSP